MNINPFIITINTVLEIYSFILVIWIILSWLIAFNIINRHQPFVNYLMKILHKLTEPVLKPIRKFMPDLGGVDLSPIIVFILIQLVENILLEYFYVY